jgi:hypothetical protein
MLTRQWEELNVVEGSACNYFHPTWKPTSRVMATKVSQIAPWVLMCSLPWAQCKRWIPIKSMGCAHRGMPTIEGWGSPSHVQSVASKIEEDNRKVGKIGWVVNKVLTLGPEHDKPYMSYQRTCWKRYDGVNVPKWNLEVEPFTTRWVVQMGWGW